MSARFDAVVIGLGPGGEVAAGRLLAAGQRVAVIERELIGGECAYWAYIPSKTLLRATEAATAAGRVAGIERPAIDWPALRDYRDYMVRHLDDTTQVEGYTEKGATVIRGDARLVGPGQVLVIGGSAVGVELGQFLARMGADVTILERSAHLVPRETARMGELALQSLRADGIDVRTGVEATRVLRAGPRAAVEVSDGSRIETEVILLGTGRRPRTAGLGLETAGARLDEHGAVVVDEHCRAGTRLWALGDVTGVALFTHVAMYQGRLVAANLLGERRRAHYEGIPRVVFADPEIAPSD